ncbi:hypothetical protein HYALB_00009755 [Hymenoscyphus albidus]|uniref:Uncharacterized protein n=1 Tax=Hymenoscyphus albidus TaxID=595503 RepID=A0A9N9PSJ5_9HELO|nr:hypothetical protein HYALB_00009755 [Hymenoscyphus albidus]
MNIQQLSFFTGQGISAAALNESDTYIATRFYGAYDVIQKNLFNKLKVLLDEAIKSTEFEPFALSEIRRFRRHLSKATSKIEDYSM